jgi:hypothetical protein
MTKRKIHKVKTRIGLNFFQSVAIFFLGLLYYYGLVCIVMTIFAIFIVILTGNIKPLIDIPLNEALPVIVGSIFCYPAYFAQKHLLSYWKQLQNK